MNNRVNATYTLIQQVYTIFEDDYKKLKAKLTKEAGNILILSKHNAPKVVTSDNESKSIRYHLWIMNYSPKPIQILTRTGLVSGGWTKRRRTDGSAERDDIHSPHTFPPKKMRRDCFYNSTPAMLAPKHLENVDSCEVSHQPNLLSVTFYKKIPKFNNFIFSTFPCSWKTELVAKKSGRVAGIVHCMEGWDVHECGNAMFDIEKIWRASIEQGFRRLINDSNPNLQLPRGKLFGQS